MPIKRQSETTSGIFTIKECLYESGLIEISFYTAEVLDGAGPILRGMISRQDSKCKFVGYTSTRNRVAIGRKKDDVILATIVEIERDMRRDGSMRFYEPADPSPPHYVSSEEAYGSTVRLSNNIRCF